VNRKLSLILALPALAASHLLGAQATRVALVVGNARYESTTGALRNSDNDAKSVAKALRTLGFTVMERHDLKRDALLQTFAQFHKLTTGAQVALFYYAGHGLSVDGQNYLIPLKAGYDPANLDAVGLRMMAETHLFNAEQAVVDMASGGAACTIAILDACRTSALDAQQSRGLAQGGSLVGMSPPTGSLVAFATDSGHTALDGTGRNGLYTEELLKNLITPGITIEQVFKRTRGEVIQKSNGVQVPAEYSRLVGEDIYLAGQQATLPQTTPTPTVAQISTPSPTSSQTREEALADIGKLAAEGTDHSADCLDKLTALVKQTGPGDDAAVPLDTLLDKIKDDLKSQTGPSQKAIDDAATCDRILAALPKSLSPQSPRYIDLEAKANSRRGDALILLGHAQDALAAYNAALQMHPVDPYILYNRGNAELALNQKDAARTDFQAAETNAASQPKAKRLAREALENLKSQP
jgi:tetratricopeptide (TPR) repeat protein